LVAPWAQKPRHAATNDFLSFRAIWKPPSSSAVCTVGENAMSRRNECFSGHRSVFSFPSALFSCILFSQKALHSIKIAGIYGLDLFFGTIF